MAKRSDPTVRESGPDSSWEDDRLAELRELILGGEKRRLARLEERLENPHFRTRDLSEVLPEAFSLRASPRTSSSAWP